MASTGLTDIVGWLGPLFRGFKSQSVSSQVMFVVLYELPMAE